MKKISIQILTIIMLAGLGTTSLLQAHGGSGWGGGILGGAIIGSAIANSNNRSDDRAYYRTQQQLDTIDAKVDTLQQNQTRTQQDTDRQIVQQQKEQIRQLKKQLAMSKSTPKTTQKSAPAKKTRLQRVEADIEQDFDEIESDL